MVGDGGVVVRQIGALLEMVRSVKLEKRKEAVYPVFIQF